MFTLIILSCTAASHQGANTKREATFLSYHVETPFATFQNMHQGLVSC